MGDNWIGSYATEKNLEVMVDHSFNMSQKADAGTKKTKFSFVLH